MRLAHPGRCAPPTSFRLLIAAPADLLLDPRRVSSRLLVDLSARADLEWKLTYVGSAESDSYDQELDTCMVGPVPVGINSFPFEVSLSHR